MANQQIQFPPGMSIPEFLRRLGTEAQCAEAVKLARWPDGFCCPRCAVAQHYVVGHGARRLFQCGSCRHQASLTAGSLMGTYSRGSFRKQYAYKVGPAKFISRLTTT